MLDALRCCVHDGGLRQEEHGLSHSGHHPLVLCQVQHRLQPPHLRVHEQKGLWFSSSVNSRCSKELYRFVPLHSRVLSAGQICNEKYFFTALMARKAILPSTYTLTHTHTITHTNAFAHQVPITAQPLSTLIAAVFCIFISDKLMSSVNVCVSILSFSQ